MISKTVLLSVENLTAGYGKLAIVQDISLKVEKGDLLAIVGPNGSGKSTLVKSIMGLTTIFGGKVVFEGRDITSMTPESIARTGLGFVPQISNIFTDMSVRENLELGSVAGVETRSNRLKERIEEIFRVFPNLRPKTGYKASSLSGGERQMLAIGRALMARPKLLVLDEPSAGIAPIVAEQLFSRLAEMNHTGATLILVEQNVRKAWMLANKGVVLVQGKKVFDGQPNLVSKEEDLARFFLSGVGA